MNRKHVSVWLIVSLVIGVFIGVQVNKLAEEILGPDYVSAIEGWERAYLALATDYEDLDAALRRKKGVYYQLSMTNDALEMQVAELLATPTPPIYPDALKSNGVFNYPTWGYIGLSDGQWYDNSDHTRLHPGIDIWATTEYGFVWTDEENERGNPVYAVYEGWLMMASDQSLNICHERGEGTIDVCSYYAHLKDIPEQFAKLRKGCYPSSRVWVEQGELLGYMDLGSGISVHLHFSIKDYDEAKKCAYPEPLRGAVDDPNWEHIIYPFDYFGSSYDDYWWLAEFP